MSAVRVTLQNVGEKAEPTLAGLTVKFVMVGPTVSMMLKVTAPDVPPPGGEVKTVTLAEPRVAMSAALIVALSWVGLTKVVARPAPFHWTTEAGTKFAPLTMSVKLGPPA